MADFADLLGESEEASRFQAAAGARKEAINSLLWNQTSGGPSTQLCTTGVEYEA